MKTNIAIFVLASIWLAGAVLAAITNGGCANAQYAKDLQTCILETRVSDAGSYEARLAQYNRCADALDAGVSK